MKRMMWVVLLCVGLSPVATPAQEERERERIPPPAATEQLRQMDMQSRQLELMARQEKLRFEKEMNDLTLAQRRFELEKPMRTMDGRGGPACGPWLRLCPRGMAPFFLVCALVHILLTVWAYQDTRRRNTASGIWTIVVLLTGLLGAAVYALVRLGDKPAST